MNSAGDEVLVVTSLGITFLGSTGDNPPDSIGDNFPVLMIDKLCLGRIFPTHPRLRASAGEN